jgi:hypothetical protein
MTHVTLDGGVTWEEKELETWIPYVTLLSMDGSGNNLVGYLNTYPDYPYYYSHDGGDTWTEITDIVAADYLTMYSAYISKNGNVIVLWHSTKLYISINSGVSFTEKTYPDLPEGSGWRIVINDSGDTASILYWLAGTPNTAGIFQSADNGDTWINIQEWSWTSTIDITYGAFIAADDGTDLIVGLSNGRLYLYEYTVTYPVKAYNWLVQLVDTINGQEAASKISKEYTVSDFFKETIELAILQDYKKQHLPYKFAVCRYSQDSWNAVMNTLTWYRCFFDNTDLELNPETGIRMNKDGFTFRTSKPGTYNIYASWMVTLNSVPVTRMKNISFALFKNGTLYSTLDADRACFVTPLVGDPLYMQPNLLQGFDVIELTETDYFDFRIYFELNVGGTPLGSLDFHSGYTDIMFDNSRRILR